MQKPAVSVSSFHDQSTQQATNTASDKIYWCLEFLNLAYLYMFVHTHHPKPKAAVYFERVQPARRQSVMVHVSMSVACTALSI